MTGFCVEETTLVCDVLFNREESSWTHTWDVISMYTDGFAMEGEGHKTMARNWDDGFVISHDDVRLMGMIEVGDTFKHSRVGRHVCSGAAVDDHLD